MRERTLAGNERPATKHTCKNQKRQVILLALGAELEPKRKTLAGIDSTLEDGIFFMLNNLNIRHNNLSPDNKNYKEFVSQMSSEMLESWYDELYQMVSRRRTERTACSSDAAALFQKFSGTGLRLVLPFCHLHSAFPLLFFKIFLHHLSYVLSESLEVDFVLTTIKQLIISHGIDLSAETLIHSDQGCHYTSHKFIEIVKDAGLRQSMSRRGNCWDNAPQESFFGHMKDELDFSGCTQFREVKLMIDDWMDYYNNDRYQWKLAKLSPNEYYRYITTGYYPIVGVPPPIRQVETMANELGNIDLGCF